MDLPSIISDMNRAELHSSGGNFTVPTEADFMATTVPSHFDYEVVARFPALDANGSLGAALCVFWPDSIPPPLQR